MEMTQLELPDPALRSPEELQGLLQQRSHLPVRLTMTRNRVSMVSVSFEPNEIRVRLHRAFLSAPDAVIGALAGYLRRRRTAAWRVVAEFAGTIQPDSPAQRKSRVRTRGTVYDLETIRRKVEHECFNHNVGCRVGWGRAGSRRRRARSRHIRYGSYVRAENLVRINPLLDDARVPAQFLEYIVFHEMLHAVVPSERGERWSHHTTTFRKLEDRFPNVQAMRRLCSELVTVLV